MPPTDPSPDSSTAWRGASRVNTTNAWRRRYKRYRLSARDTPRMRKARSASVNLGSWGKADSNLCKSGYRFPIQAISLFAFKSRFLDAISGTSRGQNCLIHSSFSATHGVCSGRAAMPRYRNVFTPLNIGRIREMAQNGRSSPEMARAIGSTAASVRAFCCRHKIRITRRGRANGSKLGRTSAPSIRDLVVHMPAPLFVEFHRKAEHLRMSPSVLAGNLLAAITLSDIFEAVLDDRD